MRIESQRGQAGVEALIALPVLALVCALLVQALLVAAAAVSAEAAAGAGARALARGDEPAGAARAALPRALSRSIRIDVRHGAVAVAVAPIILVPGWPWRTVRAVQR